jgi:tetratricopeptide (TPR) repeat protein
MESTVNARRPLLVGVALLGLTLAAFWPVTSCDFVQFDDPYYVTENSQINRGLTWEGVRWSFGASVGGNWHPATWISHMVDCELFGLKASGHHFTSLLFHVANTGLLFLVLFRMTGMLWRPAMVAALFGLHPLHVESVAWVAERKDVLSTFFFLLTVLAYAAYVRASPAAGQGASGERASKGRALVFYLLMLVFFSLGLMSKPMVVTLPAVLILLDFWPLGRIAFPLRESSRAKWRELMLEKAPLFALSAVVSVVTVVCQHAAGAVTTLDVLPMDVRLANAVVSYVRYLKLTVWPAGLAVFYPVAPWSSVAVAGSVVILAVGSILAVQRLKNTPWTAVGWFWFLGTLVPVIGVIQVGQQAMADRYSYIPLIGVFILVTWWVGEWAGKGLPRWVMAVAAGLMLSGCFWGTRAQLGYWRDNIRLFQHALDVTRDNAVAHNNLGVSLFKAGDVAGARGHFEEAIRLKPNYTEALANLGSCQEQQGQTADALALLERAVQLSPSATANYNLANALAHQQRWAEAEARYRGALEIRPDFPEAHYNLGNLLMQRKESGQAEREYRAALVQRPGYVLARLSLGALLAGQGRYKEAISEFERVVAAEPGFADAHYNLAAAFAAVGRWPDAETHYATTCRLRPEDADARFGWGFALLNEGELEAAAARFQELLLVRPDDRAHYYAGLANDGLGRDAQALLHYREAVRLSPSAPTYLNDLAWMLATNPRQEIRNGPEAVRLAETACRLGGEKEPRFWGTLDAAYAESGRFDEALVTATKARELALAAGQQPIAQAAEERLALYRERKPYRSPSRTP